MKRATAESVQPMSLEAWAALDEDVEGELVDGVLEEEEMPTVLHEMVVLWLAAMLRPWVVRRRGIVLASEAKIAVGPRRGRKPDLSVFLPPHLPPIDAALIRVAPFLVAEILSPRPRDVRRDLVDKRRDYARVGIKHYWVIDPVVQVVEPFELAGGRYKTSGAVSGRVRLAGYPRGIDFESLWTELDALAKQR